MPTAQTLHKINQAIRRHGIVCGIWAELGSATEPGFAAHRMCTHTSQYNQSDRDYVALEEEQSLTSLCN
jgi:hypothetical protein